MRPSARQPPRCTPTSLGCARSAATAAATPPASANAWVHAAPPAAMRPSARQPLNCTFTSP
eukprot:3203145-Prymnesium_polylepis.1